MSASNADGTSGKAGASHDPQTSPHENDSTSLGHNSSESAISALMSVLSSESNLEQIRSNQKATLDNLKSMKESLISINKSSNEQYQASAISFLRAARLARQAKDDLNDVTRRLAVIKAKLDKVGSQ